MATEQNPKFQLRIARDFLLDQVVFPMAATYPLPDVPVSAQNAVVFTDKTGKIQVLPFQEDTLYRLKDEQKKATGAAPVVADGVLILETDTLTKEEDDYTYTIAAVKRKSGLGKQLLNAVTLKVGVDTNIAPTLEAEIIEFGSTAGILLPGTQNGATYKIVGADEVTELSKAVSSGEGGDLLIRTFMLEEDTPYKVKVIKTKTPSISGIIVQQEGKPEMLIKVYPKDTMVPEIAGTEAGIDYNTVAAITVGETQESVDYQLIFKDIDDDSVNKSELLDTTSGKKVKGTGDAIVLKTDKLTEDPTLVVLATKRSSNVTREIPVSLFVPVKPDPDKTLSIVETTVAAGESATVKVSNPQRGIYYQLVDADGNDTGWRDYYHKNYGVGKARVGIEFALDEKPDDSVLLSTGPLDKETTFHVVAQKATTGKTVGIAGTVTVKLG